MYDLLSSIPENLSERHLMAPPGIRDKLPLLNQLIKWFLDPGVVADSPVFKLHHQVNISCGNRSLSIFCCRVKIVPCSQLNGFPVRHLQKSRFSDVL